MMDLPTADREQLAAFIVRISSWSSHRFSRVTSYCFCSGMNVYWLFGPPLSKLSFLPATISRTGSLNSCGDPAPQSPVPKEQAPLRTPFLAIPPNPTIHSRPLLFLVTALSSVSPPRPRVPVSPIALQPLALVIWKTVSWLPRKKLNVPGMVKSTPSTSIQMPRFPVQPYYMLVCTTAWLPDSVYVSDLRP